MVALLQLLSAFCCFSSLLSFWLPWIYSPFPFCMEFRNGVLLQLIECIESTRNEVKRKMIETHAYNSAPKSHADFAREKNRALTSQPHLVCSSSHRSLACARDENNIAPVPVAVARREP
jgi:hypothetical protein